MPWALKNSTRKTKDSSQTPPTEQTIICPTFLIDNYIKKLKYYALKDKTKQD